MYYMYDDALNKIDVKEFNITKDVVVIDDPKANYFYSLTLSYSSLEDAITRVKNALSAKYFADKFVVVRKDDMLHVSVHGSESNLDPEFAHYIPVVRNHRMHAAQSSLARKDVKKRRPSYRGDRGYFRPLINEVYTSEQIINQVSSDTWLLKNNSKGIFDAFTYNKEIHVEILDIDGDKTGEIISLRRLSSLKDDLWVVVSNNYQ